jgi:hypothetical protein
MIELAIELTKLAQNDCQQQTQDAPAAQTPMERTATEAAADVSQQDLLHVMLSGNRILVQNDAPVVKPDSIPGQPSLLAGRLI